MARDKIDSVDDSAIPFYERYINSLSMPIVAVLFALIVGSFFMIAIGKNPVFAYKVLFGSSLGNLRGFYETLVSTTPLIFTGLAVAFAFRTGLFNIGGDGQFLIAYVATAWIGYIVKLPAIIHVPLALLAGIIAAGLWGGFAGYLKASFGVHEVITTIMMNYIALYLTGYLIGGPLMAKGQLPATPKIFDSAKLLRLFNSRLNLGFFLALLAAWFIYYILWKTTTGYEVRAVGLNPEGAEYGGISIAKNMVLAMFVSGALAGLAGSVQVMGLEYRAYQPFGFIGYGFTGIAVALLGKNHPAGVVLGAFLFGVLSKGANQMQSIAHVPKEVVEIIQAIIIFFVAAEFMFRLITDKMKKKQGDITDDNK